MPRRPLWKKPQLRQDEEQRREHKTSWLELFLDLIFAAVIDTLATTLAGDVSWYGIVKFCLLLLPVWWIWIGSTFYNDRFETDDVSHRLFTLLMMLPLATLADSAPEALEKTSQGFALSYAAARLILIFMWVRGGWHSPAARPLTRGYAVGFSVSVLLWVVSVLVPAPTRFVLWGVGLLIDLVTPITTLGIEARLPRLSTSHLPERFGLFTLIVLGESVISVVEGAPHGHEITLLTATLVVLGLALSFSLWWIYFDHIISRPPKANIWWTLCWAYTHLLLVMSLTALGAGVRDVVAREGADLSTPLRWLICGSLTVSLAAMGVIEATLEKVVRGRPVSLKGSEILRLLAAAAAFLIGLCGGGLNTVVLFVLLLGLGIVQVIHGFYRPLPHDPTAEGTELFSPPETV